MRQYFQNEHEIRKSMLDVIIALIPVVGFSIYYNGIKTLFIILATTISCVVAEYLFSLLTKRKETVSDLSAVVTGIILGLLMPVGISYLIPIFGGFFAILIVKMIFGGFGGNFVNISALTIAFLANAYILKMSIQNQAVDTTKLFIGSVSAQFASSSLIPIIVGFLYLAIRKRINPLVPILTVVFMLLSAFLFGTKPEAIYSMVIIYFIAVYMATDPVTSPKKLLSVVFYTLIIGGLGTLFTRVGHNPYGFIYSLLIANITSPFLDSLFTKENDEKVKKEVA